MENEPTPIGKDVDAILLRLMPDEYLESYQHEEERHRETVRTINLDRKWALQRVRRLFGKLKIQKETEAEEQYAEALAEENARHDAWLAELRAKIRGHRKGVV